MVTIRTFLFLVLFYLHHASSTDPEIEAEEIRARDFLQFLNKKNEEHNNKQSLAHWAYASNITDANLQNQVRPSYLLFSFPKPHSS